MKFKTHSRYSLILLFIVVILLVSFSEYNSRVNKPIILRARPFCWVKTYTKNDSVYSLKVIVNIENPNNDTVSYRTIYNWQSAFITNSENLHIAQGSSNQNPSIVIIRPHDSDVHAIFLTLSRKDTIDGKKYKDDPFIEAGNIDEKEREKLIGLVFKIGFYNISDFRSPEYKNKIIWSNEIVISKGIQMGYTTNTKSPSFH